MNYTIDKNRSDPAYIQLYRHFVKDIVAGVYPFGSRLPSKRVIAEETGVSVITAEHAVTLLNEEGYVESRQRSGVFVTYRGEDFLGEAGQTGLYGKALSGEAREFSGDAVQRGKEKSGNAGQREEVFRETAEQVLRKGEFPFSVIAKTMRKVLLDYGEKILVKSPNHGCPELRSEICLYLARSRGIFVRPSQVIVGSGAEYLYGLIVQLLGTDRIFALENPSYNKIRQVYESMGITCDMLAMTSDGISTKELERTKARILHVTPFNSFPSGVTAGISKKHEYIRWARNRNGILIEDNYDSELTVSRKPEDPLYSMDPDGSVIYLNTFSGTVAPSMRIGYMVLPIRMADTFNDRLGFYSCTVPIFDQYVLAELLRSGDFERHINRMRRARRVQGCLKTMSL